MGALLIFSLTLLGGTSWLELIFVNPKYLIFFQLLGLKFLIPSFSCSNACICSVIFHKWNNLFTLIFVENKYLAHSCTRELVPTYNDKLLVVNTPKMRAWEKLNDVKQMCWVLALDL